eukprot:336349-Prymnesium_polylepis.1
MLSAVFLLPYDLRRRKGAAQLASDALHPGRMAGGAKAVPAPTTPDLSSLHSSLKFVGDHTTRISTQVACILITSSRTRRDISHNFFDQSCAPGGGVPRNVGERTCRVSAVAQGQGSRRVLNPFPFLV